METKIPPLEAHLGYLLRQVSNAVSGAFAKSLQASNASVAEWLVLHHLSEQKQATSSELANALTMTPGAISKIVEKLRAKEWVTSSVQRQDHRIQLLSLTRAGRSIVPEFAVIADRNDLRFFGVLNAKESATLRRLLSKVARNNMIREIPAE